MTQPFHTVVIGAGSGGLTVAFGLARFGKSVALVERGRVGGDCTNTGCIPSKTLIHLATEFAAGGSAGGSAGVSSGADVLEAVRARRDRLWREEEEWIVGVENLEVVRGTGRLLGPRSVEVETERGDTREISAANIVLATGSRPVTLDIQGLPSYRRHTNESIFDLDEPPIHLAIIGAGVIGSELAFAFRKLGSAVTLVEMAGRPLPQFEPEVSELMRHRFREAGIELLLKAEAHAWSEPLGSAAGSGARPGGTLRTAGPAGEEAVQDVDAVLFAVGRRPSLGDVGLHTVDLIPERDGLQTNAFGRTAAATVYAIGDVNRRSAFTHTANAQGRRLVQKLALPWLPVGREGAWPAAVFTDPEVAQVGPTREELELRIPRSMIRTVRVELADTDRAYTMGLDRGFVLLHAMRLTGRLLSATIVAPRAGEMLPVLTQAVNGGPRLYRLAKHVFAYPTLTESVRKAADTFVFDTLQDLPAEIRHYARHRFRRPEQTEPT